MQLQDLRQRLRDLGAKPVHEQRLLRLWANALPWDSGRRQPQHFLPQALREALPALTAELVDWARATGFRVVAAGKGTKYLPAYHDVTPAGVWSHYGLSAGEAQSPGGR